MVTLLSTFIWLGEGNELNVAGMSEWAWDRVEGWRTWQALAEAGADIFREQTCLEITQGPELV